MSQQTLAFNTQICRKQTKEEKKKNLERSFFFLSFFSLTHQRSGFAVAFAHRVELPESSEARAPLSEIVIVLVRVRRRRLQRAEGAGDRPPALVPVDLDGVVRRGRRVVVGFVKTHVDELVHIHAVRARVLPRPGHELQVWLDVLARQVAVDAVWVLQRGDVERLGVLLAAAFVVVADDVLPHVFVVLDDQGLVLVSPQGHK